MEVAAMARYLALTRRRELGEAPRVVPALLSLLRLVMVAMPSERNPRRQRLVGREEKLLQSLHASRFGCDR